MTQAEITKQLNELANGRIDIFLCITLGVNELTPETTIFELTKKLKALQK